MKKLLLSTVSGAACVLAPVSVASAADLPARPLLAAPAPVLIPFTWTGCYIGGHVGGGWGTKTWSDLGGDDFSDNTSYNVNGIVGGVQGGCDYQFIGPWFGVPWVVGIEGKWSWTDLKGSSALPFEAEQSVFDTRVHWIATLTGRLGLAAFDRGLIYVKGGGAWARERHTLTEFIPEEAGTASVSVDVSRSGWTIGTGIEWAFARNWSAKLEYNFMDFGSKTVLFSPLADDPSAVDQRIHTFTVGLNYRF
jgi:outer membrane immunogenic protein